jgi:hypothetical protein
MPNEKRDDLDRDDARKRFRQHLARADVIMTAHARKAMAGAHGKVKKAAPIFTRLVQTDGALAAELDAIQRLEKYVFPPCELPSVSLIAPRAKSKRRKGHAKKI